MNVQTDLSLPWENFSVSTFSNIDALLVRGCKGVGTASYPSLRASGLLRVV